ncbi:MAG TPA: hypothetical protein VFA51_05175 [Candidatus Udaeobacter sp.]|nr:hypothetical protein [Candidatus Udaeobacter sp.]
MENSAGVYRHFDVNCVMVKRALCVALGLFGALSLAVAQQAHHSTKREQSSSRGATGAPLSLNLYNSKTLRAAEHSILLHNGSVPLWFDGTPLANGIIDRNYGFGQSWVQMGFMSADLMPAPFLNSVQPSPQRSNGRAHASDGKDLGIDPNDSPEEMLSSAGSPIYCGGEVGFLYGRWSGKGGGDMWETYVVGTVGNDKFQITAGASFDEWNPNGRSVRFRSFASPR